MAAYTTIDDPTAHFQAVKYAGNGAANHSITLDGDTDLEPDLVWIKNLDQADPNQLIDSVRGVTKTLDSDSNDGEVTDTDTLDAFESDGFRVDADVKVNTNTETYVSWCWKMGTTSGISGSPDITPSGYSFNATAKQSIIAYSGSTNDEDTIPHGLGVAPNMVIVKCRAATERWSTYHTGITGADNGTIYLESDAAYAVSGGSRWERSNTNTTLFGLGDDGTTNAASTYVAYCFADVQGFSKFGSYEGNANVDGTFVYTGFRPACVIIKDADATSQWRIFDNKRGYNGAISYQYPSATTTNSGPEDHIDFHSNGFKLRKNDDANDSGTHVYWAWAEAPFVNSNGVPCNAR